MAEEIDVAYWDKNQGRWDGHRLFDTVDHHHVSCYYPADGHDDCDITVVGCRDGRWYIEDNWGGDAKTADQVWNPFDKNSKGPVFFDSMDAALSVAVGFVVRICGVPSDQVSVS